MTTPNRTELMAKVEEAADNAEDKLRRADVNKYNLINLVFKDGARFVIDTALAEAERKNAAFESLINEMENILTYKDYDGENAHDVLDRLRKFREYGK